MGFRFMEKVFLLWGILFGAPGLCIDVADQSMAISNILIFAVIVYQAIIQIKNSIMYFYGEYVLWYVCLCSIAVTSLISFVTLPDTWFFVSLSRTLKIVVVLSAFIFLYPRNELIILKKNFIRGLYYSAIINMLWAWVQMYCGYIQGFNVNRVLFREMLHLSSNVNWDQSVAHDIVYRMSGLSWEPATLGFIVCIGYIVTNNKLLKVLFIITMLLSTSKSGIICLTLLIIRDVWWCISIEKITTMVRVQIRSIVILSLCIIVTGGIFIEYNDYIMKAKDEVIFIIDLISSSLFSPQDNFSSNIHSMYYFELFNVLNKEEFFNVLFGVGMFAAGYPYEMNRLVIFSGAWIPESDFITIIVGSGIIGGILYYLILIRNVLYTKLYKDVSLNFFLFVYGFFYGTGLSCFIVLFLLSLREKDFESYE